MAGKEHVALVLLQVVVESLDAFQVQMVGGSVQDKAVGVLQLHACYHTTHLLAAGKNVHLLQYLFAREEHTSKEALEIYLIAFAELAEPVHQIQL